MKAVLDTCVIYPTVMRQMLLRVAKTGLFTPLWSARIIE
ncbi:MAG: PIN domain-containing protein, partial [Roseovarius indicus]